MKLMDKMAELIAKCDKKIAPAEFLYMVAQALEVFTSSRKNLKKEDEDMLSSFCLCITSAVAANCLTQDQLRGLVVDSLFPDENGDDDKHGR